MDLFWVFCQFLFHRHACFCQLLILSLYLLKHLILDLKLLFNSLYLLRIWEWVFWSNYFFKHMFKSSTLIDIKLHLYFKFMQFCAFECFLQILKFCIIVCEFLFKISYLPFQRIRHVVSKGLLWKWWPFLWIMHYHHVFNVALKFWIFILHFLHLGLQNHIFLAHLVRLNFELNHILIKPLFIPQASGLSLFKHVNRSSRPVHALAFLLGLNHRRAWSKCPFWNKGLRGHVKCVMSNLQGRIIVLLKTIGRLHLVRRKSEIIVCLELRSKAVVFLVVLLIRFGRFLFLVLVFLKISKTHIWRAFTDDFIHFLV